MRRHRGQPPSPPRREPLPNPVSSRRCRLEPLANWLKATDPVDFVFSLGFAVLMVCVGTAIVIAEVKA